MTLNLSAKDHDMLHSDLGAAIKMIMTILARMAEVSGTDELLDIKGILGWKVAWERSQLIVQAIVDHSPKTRWYFSDAFDVYASLFCHWGRYAVSEGNNAELRRNLARLARSSRCLSRCPYPLHCAVRLFVHYFNQRQSKKHRFPKYSFHNIDFVPSPF